MTILITGCNGQLGTEMRLMSAQYPQHRYLYTDVAELDITDRERVHSYVRENGVNLIVNCAAYTNVDKAEEDEKTAHVLNAQAVENLATAGCRIIHISTDYVFSGEGCQPYREVDEPAPRTAYGRTKWEGERLLQAANKDAVIFRTAWLYSPFGNNFVKTMLKYGREREELRVVYDQIGTPTYAKDLARIIYTAIEDKEWHPGIYHLTDEGVCSWYDFTVEILRRAGISCKVTPILSNEYQYRTPRPHYSVLDKKKVKETFHVSIPYWTDSLDDCLRRLEEKDKD